MPQPIRGIECRCCQVMLQCSIDSCALMLRPIFLASQLVMGTSSVRQFIQFSIPIRRFFTRGRDPGLVVSAARLRAADGPNRSLQLCEK